MSARAAANRPAIRRDLRLFNLFRLLATSYLFVPIFMLFEASRGLSFFDRLALGGLYSAVVICVEVPTGVFADRLGRRRSMMAGAALMVASCLIALRAHSLAPFIVAECLAAISMALCSGADSAYLFDLLADNDRVHEYGHRESTASAWHLFGSAIAFAGGGALAQIDLGLPYLVTAVVATGALVVATLLRDDGQPQILRPVAAPAESGLRSWSSQMRAALDEVARNARLRWLVGYSAVVFVLLRATIYAYQPYLDARGLSTFDIGLLFAAVYVVASFVAYQTHHLRRRFGDRVLMWGLVIALTASFLGLAGAGRGPWMLALLFIQAMANGLYAPLTKPLLNREIRDSRRRAAVLSVESMVRRAAMGLFAPLAGCFGQGHLMVVCGAAGLLGVALLFVTRPLLGDRARSGAIAAPFAHESSGGQGGCTR